MKYLEGVSRLVVSMLFVVGMLVATGAEASPAGEVDFGDLSSAYGEAKVEINLNKNLLSMAGVFAAKDDPDSAEMLKNIDKITVRVYPTKGKPQPAMKVIDEVTKSIRKAHWDPIVSVNDNGQKVRIFAKTTDNKMDGMVVMVVDNNNEGEAVFINIVGQIDPQKLSELTQKFNVSIPQEEAKK